MHRLAAHFIMYPDPTIQMSQQKSRHRPGNVYPIFYCPVLITQSQPQITRQRCPLRTSAAAHLLKGSTRCFSAYLGWKESLFELQPPSYHHPDLWHQGLLVHTNAAHWIFLLFQTLSLTQSIWSPLNQSLHFPHLQRKTQSHLAKIY